MWNKFIWCILSQGSNNSGFYYFCYVVILHFKYALDVTLKTLRVIFSGIQWSDRTLQSPCLQGKTHASRERLHGDYTVHT